MEPAPLKESQNGRIEGIVSTYSWTTWFTKLVALLNRSPEISSGTAAPTTTPTKVGDVYCDTTAGKVYIATGIASSADWKILN